MKVYTKKGDNGDSQLIGGKIVRKNHAKLECYGSIDELNSFIGNLYDDPIDNLQKNNLRKIQNQLFNLGCQIASNPNNNEIKLPNIKEENVVILEEEIDKMDMLLPKLTDFILPSGAPSSSKCHIARTVCRRAERNLISLAEIETVNPLHIKYLNRLSDYLFVLARFILMENNIPAIEWEKD